MTENIILCGFLGACSCYDCKERRIPVWLLSAGILTGGIYAVLMLVLGRYSWQVLAAGAVPGAAMLAYAKLTEGKLGLADGMMVIPTGLLHQWEQCTAEVMTACFLTFLVSACLLLAGKANRKTQIPFAPFLLTAVVILWAIQV